jgi:hypothetical protein
MDDTQQKTNPFALPADFMAGRPAAPASVSNRDRHQDLRHPEVIAHKFVFIFPQLVTIWSQLPFIRLPYLADVIPPWLVEQSQRNEMWQQLDETPYLKAMLMQRKKTETFGSNASHHANPF